VHPMFLTLCAYSSVFTYREALKPPPPVGQLMTGKNGPSLVRTAIAARNSRFSSAAAAGGDEDYAGYSD
jgi:hypothetical protein